MQKHEVFGCVRPAHYRDPHRHETFWDITAWLLAFVVICGCLLALYGLLALIMTVLS
jgi:hypothetical protein